MKRIAVLASAVVMCFGVVYGHAETLPAAPVAYIVSPLDGAEVPPTFNVVFGLRGMGVAPAGVEKAKTGHHHLIVNGSGLPQPGKPMGNEVTHFGGGQTETTLTLGPGTHTLQLILGDHNHAPHDPPIVSDKISVTVK